MTLLGRTNAQEVDVGPPTIFKQGLNSRYVAVLNKTRGEMLYSNFADESWDFSFSVAKAMVALLIAELKSSVIDSESITWTAQDEEDEGSFNASDAGLQVGDVLTWRNCIRAIMFDSAGDATRAAGRVLGNEDLGESLTSALGLPRFVEMMNERANQIPGYGRSVYTETQGVGKFDPNTDHHNSFTARDLALIAGEVFANNLVSTISSASTTTLTISGPNARTVALTNTSPIDTDPAFRGGKNGGGSGSSFPTTRSMVFMWEAPNGDEIAAALMHATSTADRNADASKIVSDILTDFPYLGPPDAP